MVPTRKQNKCRGEFRVIYYAESRDRGRGERQWVVCRNKTFSKEHRVNRCCMCPSERKRSPRIQFFSTHSLGREGRRHENELSHRTPSPHPAYGQAEACFSPTARWRPEQWSGARVDIFGFSLGSGTCWRLLYLNKHFLFAKEYGLKAET